MICALLLGTIICEIPDGKFEEVLGFLEYRMGWSRRVDSICGVVGSAAGLEGGLR